MKIIPMFSKRHYEAIAEVLMGCDRYEDIESGLADLFEDDNPRFDRDRFLEACEGFADDDDIDEAELRG